MGVGWGRGGEGGKIEGWIWKPYSARKVSGPDLVHLFQVSTSSIACKMGKEGGKRVEILTLLVCGNAVCVHGAFWSFEAIAVFSKEHGSNN